MPNRELLREIQRRSREQRLSELNPERKPLQRISYATQSDLEAVKDSLDNTEKYLKDIIEKTASKSGTINLALPVQRSLSIPVKSDEGGLGTTVRPTSGQVPIGNSDGTYTPGTVSGGSGITRSISSVAVPTNAGATVDTDYVYFVSGSTTITLPTAVGNANRYTIKNTGAATVTIATTAAQTIDGSASASLPVANTSLDIVSDNSNWRVV